MKALKRSVMSQGTRLICPLVGGRTKSEMWRRGDVRTAVGALQVSVRVVKGLLGRDRIHAIGATLGDCRKPLRFVAAGPMQSGRGVAAALQVYGFP